MEVGQLHPPPLQPPTYLRQGRGGGGDGSEQAEEMVGRSVGQHLQVVGRVLVVAGDKQRHHPAGNIFVAYELLGALKTKFGLAHKRIVNFG